MADISMLSRLVLGVQRNVDVSQNSLVVGSLKVGSASPTELTKAILDNLLPLQNGSDFANGTNAHTHDGRYFTETELGAQTNGASGASNIGIDVTPAFANFTSGSTVQSALEGIDSALSSAGNEKSDSIFRIVDNGDATKKIAFEASAITTGTTRTITMPDSAVDLGKLGTAIQRDGSVAFTANQPLAGFKLTGLGAPTANGDALRFDQLGAANGIATLDANSLIPISQMPPAALERLVIVADQAARFALTTATVQNGDTVKQTDTGVMYFVKDDADLGTAGGYSVYTAGTASAVAWSGVTGTPTTLSGYGITDYVAAAKAAAVADSITDAITDVAPSQNAVFDALALKAPLASPTFTGTVSGITKTMVGLGNVDNTADANKDVSSAINIKAASEVAGEEFAATSLFAIRYGQNAETAGRVYKAAKDATSTDNFYVVGLIKTVGALDAADAMPVITKAGLFTATAHGFTVGKPLFLDAAGALSSTAPSTANHAVVRVGMVKDANTIDVQIQVMGVN